MTFFILGARGATIRTNYQARLNETMEDDSVELHRLGYRVVSSREYERPALGIAYFEITYELVEPPKWLPGGCGLDDEGPVNLASHGSG